MAAPAPAGPAGNPEYDLILGNLICDRLGLNPRTTSIDMTVERMGANTVWVSTQNFHTMPREDMAELQALAAARYKAVEPRG